MSFSVERVQDEAIIILNLKSGYNFEQDTPRAHQQVADIIAQIETTPVYRITDFSTIDMSFGDLVTALAAATQAEPGSMTDPHIKNVFVGNSEMVDLAADSLIQTQYGKIPTLVFSSLDDALTYARAMLR